MEEGHPPAASLPRKEADGGPRVESDEAPHVRVLVGPEQTPFLLPEAPLRKFSPFFEALLSERWRRKRQRSADGEGRKFACAAPGEQGAGPGQSSRKDGAAGAADDTPCNAFRPITFPEVSPGAFRNLLKLLLLTNSECGEDEASEEDVRELQDLVHFLGIEPQKLRRATRASSLAVVCTMLEKAASGCDVSGFGAASTDPLWLTTIDNFHEQFHTCAAAGPKSGKAGEAVKGESGGLGLNEGQASAHLGPSGSRGSEGRRKDTGRPTGTPVWGQTGCSSGWGWGAGACHPVTLLVNLHHNMVFCCSCSSFVLVPPDKRWDFLHKAIDAHFKTLKDKKLKYIRLLSFGDSELRRVLPSMNLVLPIKSEAVLCSCAGEAESTTWLVFSLSGLFHCAACRKPIPADYDLSVLGRLLNDVYSQAKGLVETAVGVCNM